MGLRVDFVLQITCIGPTIPPTSTQLFSSPHPQRTRRPNPSIIARRRVVLFHRRDRAGFAPPRRLNPRDSRHRRLHRLQRRDWAVVAFSFYTAETEPPSHWSSPPQRDRKSAGPHSHPHTGQSSTAISFIFSAAFVLSPSSSPLQRDFVLFAQLHLKEAPNNRIGGAVISKFWIYNILFDSLILSLFYILVRQLSLKLHIVASGYSDWPSFWYIHFSYWSACHIYTNCIINQCHLIVTQSFIYRKTNQRKFIVNLA
jgi:hypothetical protein